MKEPRCIIILAICLLSLQCCTVYRKGYRLTPDEVRMHDDIRIKAVYTVYGDTLLIDYKSILAVTFTDTEMIFYNSTGEFYSIPLRSIDTIDITFKNIRGSSALNISLNLLLILTLGAILIIPFVYLLLVVS
ncbi:MAG: hypothetical protein R2744_13150 [Bacteroidales bacterium]